MRLKNFLNRFDMVLRRHKQLVSCGLFNHLMYCIYRVRDQWQGDKRGCKSKEIETGQIWSQLMYRLPTRRCDNSLNIAQHGWLCFSSATVFNQWPSLPAYWECGAERFARHESNDLNIVAVRNSDQIYCDVYASIDGAIKISLQLKAYHNSSPEDEGQEMAEIPQRWTPSNKKYNSR